MKKKDLITIIFGSILFAFILSLIFPADQINKAFISPLAEKLNGPINIDDDKQSKELALVVDSILDNKQGTYGIVIKNLRTGEYYSRNGTREFQAASLYKLWAAATAHNLIEKGELRRNQIMSQDIAELNRLFDINTEEAEQSEGTITRTVDDAIIEMITISANYPALLLSAELGNSQITSFMQKLELNNSNLGQPPITTPADVAKFYELLYNGEIVNQEVSAELIEILNRQQLNDRIPKYLPEDIRVAHKTGELDAFKHDAGVIFAADAILFVALSETSSQTAAAENIANLARDVYVYFEGQHN